jgi:diaminopimelate decarboxylase
MTVMTHFSYKKNELHIEGVPLSAVAAKFGTPAYVYSATALRENFMAYRTALRNVTNEKNFTVCYAVKSNSNQSVLRLLGNLGAGADVVSGGELHRALQAAIPAGKIVYSGVGKSEAELAEAVRRNLLQINVESEGELELISKIAVKQGITVRVALRVNPDVDAKTHKKITTGKKENKFGIDLDLAPKAYARAKALPGIDPSGVAVHIGSQLLSLAPYKKAYKRVAELVKTLRKKGIDIRTVDLGGGIGIPYRDGEKRPDLDSYAEIIHDIILPLGVHVVIEPGRSISGDAGVLLTRVLNVKKTPHKTFVILDAAMNDLLRPALYDAHHAVLPVARTSERKILCDIVGPVCETGDTFHLDTRLQPMKAGDLCAIMTAGAYGAVMSSTYNTRPLAPEVLVRGENMSLVRKVQTVEDIISADLVPGWVK